MVNFVLRGNLIAGGCREQHSYPLRIGRDSWGHNSHASNLWRSIVESAKPRIGLFHSILAIENSSKCFHIDCWSFSVISEVDVNRYILVDDNRMRMGSNLPDIRSLVLGEILIGIRERLLSGGDSRYSGTGRFSHLAPHERRERGVSDEEYDTDNLHPQRGVVMPISMCLGGYFSAIWGLWRIRFSRPGHWRDLWVGLIAMLIGWPIASLGLGIFLVRVF